MTDDSETRDLSPNYSLLFLFIFGAVLFITGLIGAFTAKGAAETSAHNSSLSAGFGAILSGGSLTDANAAEAAVLPDYTGMWIFIVVGAVGIVLLIVGLTISAVRPTGVRT